MTLREQAHEDALDHSVLTDDDPLHLEERTLELFGRGVLGAGRRLVGHLDPPIACAPCDANTATLDPSGF